MGCHENINANKFPKQAKSVGTTLGNGETIVRKDLEEPFREIRRIDSFVLIGGEDLTEMQYPKQGSWLNKSAEVCFWYDMDNTVDAVCVRDDMEQPFRSVFRLKNGRYVLGVECQHS